MATPAPNPVYRTNYLPSDPQVASVWGSTLVSVATCFIFIAVTIVAYLADDKTSLTLIIGAVIAKFSTIVDFWVGSSASSQRKDAVIASSTPAKVDPPPIDVPAPPKAL